MRRTTALVLAAAVALFAPPNAALGVEFVGGSQADRDKMAAVSKQWLDSYASGDLDGLMALMHPDAMVMPHNQPTSRGTEDVRAFFAARIGRPGVTFVDELEEIRIHGDWAYVLGTFRLEVAADDAASAPYVHNGRYFVLYEKLDGEWKMLRDMDNLDPVPAR